MTGDTLDDIRVPAECGMLRNKASEVGSRCVLLLTCNLNQLTVPGTVLLWWALHESVLQLFGAH